ncbi:MAG: nucleoid-associated protein [Tepidibacter sp.]|uniref:nucleoid-associated protein n=1 Tax=Tepidibacter sp. TaxID=2529387 RepID=UPI0025F7772A|nr:nucleoid-associated protein [Tepidibacter sp.]MCT4508438.1 nucleoid-associated protein [Tepidibacter sp.]
MIIHKFIIHVLDKNSDMPVLNDFEGIMTKEIEELLQKHTKKVLRNDDLKKATFNENENVLKDLCEKIIYDNNTFVDNSKEIAQNIFDKMKEDASVESCDLAICLYSIKEDTYVEILPLEYKKSYTHSIEVVEDRLKINLVPHEVGLLSSSQKIKTAAIVGLSGVNDEYHLEILDKKAAKSAYKEESFFVKKLFDCTIVFDDKDKTKIFRDSTEKWIANSFYDDIDTARVMRENLLYTLKEKEAVDIEEFIEKTVEDDDLKYGFKEQMFEDGIEESNFTIDKKWVEKKLKKKSIKTDTGFEIKGSMDEFEDSLKYQMKKNPDGSVDIVIKNVKFYEEK